VIYETERLAVRLWTDDPADLDRVYGMYSNWAVARWLGGAPSVMPDREAAVALVHRWQAIYDQDQRFGAWAVQVRDSGLVAGTVLFKPLPGGDGDIEVGWHLHPDSWGHGYATESSRGAIERGFAAGISPIYAVVRPDNERSLAVCRRLGMRSLGRTTRWYDLELEEFRIDSATMNR
jgi:RimJ/RimL family protein N-acetyltransferase